MKININKKIQVDLSKDVVNINLEFNNENKEVIQFIEYIKKYNSSILVQRNFSIEGISYSDIIFFFSKDKSNYCQTLENIYKIKSKLYEIEKLSTDFIRISKNCIINIKHVKNFDISKTGKIQVNLDDGTSQMVSRRKIRDVLDFFDERMI